MSMYDNDYVNFSEDYELNYILKKYAKKQTEENRQQLKNFGTECKNSLNKTRLTHKEFYCYLENCKF